MFNKWVFFPSTCRIPCSSPPEDGRKKEVHSVQRTAGPEDSLGWSLSHSQGSGITFFVTFCCLANSHHEWEGNINPLGARGNPSYFFFRVSLCAGRVDAPLSDHRREGSPAPTCILYLVGLQRLGVVLEWNRSEFELASPIYQLWHTRQIICHFSISKVGSMYLLYKIDVRRQWGNMGRTWCSGRN